MRSVADEPQAGAMIALVPSASDAERLVVPGGEKAEDLHVTLCYWGNAQELGQAGILELHRAAISIAAHFPPFAAEAFGFAVFNPNNPDYEMCTVLEISGEALALVRDGLVQMIGTGESPDPWNAHLTLKYGSVGNPTVSDRLGTVVFDYIRVATPDSIVDYPLSGEPDEVFAPDGEAETAESDDDEYELESAAFSLDEPEEAEGPARAPRPSHPHEPSAPMPPADDEDYDLIRASVNTNSWSSFPVADRETPWNADEAISRISVWAGGNGNKFGKAFLWKAKDGQPLNPDSYRLPVADVINGRLVLIPRAVFSAGTILSGGHGYLEGVVSDPERDALKATVTEIYNMLQEKYQDPRVVAPWLRGRTPDEREEETANMSASVTAAVNSSGFASMPIADTSRAWDGNGARARVKAWADGDMRKYRRAFVWWDSANPENIGSYKLPIADVIDGTLTIVPKAVSAALGAINGARGGVAIPDDDISAARSVLERVQARFEDNSNTAAAPTLLAPPAEWFVDPKLDGPTPLTVTADGHVFGHIAAWGVCHMGIADRCVLAPRSRTGYKYFLNGSVLTADGSMVKVGRLTVGTGHADARLGYIPAADHYDNTGTAAAVVASGEDKWGIWVNGGVAPDATPEQIAALRRSPISGDWRRTREGGLELVAALAVNTPGYPIISRTASGEQASLIAAGLLLPEGVEMPPLPEEDFGMASRMAEVMSKIDARLGKLRAQRFADAVARIKG